MSTIKAGSIVMFKPFEEACAATRREHGFNSTMERIVKDKAGQRIRVDAILGMCISFAGCNGFSWRKESFVDVTGTTSQGFREGSKIERCTRFTESFVEGDVYTVDRVSDCGLYLWVTGHRHRVPERYFKAHVVEPKQYEAPVPELTDFADPTPKASAPFKGIAPAAEQLSDVHKFKFKQGDVVRSLNDSREFEVEKTSVSGLQFKAKGHRYSLGWLNNSEFELASNSELLNRDIVAGLVLQGTKVQYRNMGEWLDIKPDVMTIAMIKRLDFRLKPVTIDFYGTELQAPINTDITTLRTVYGVSFNNRKVFPCAISTAKANKTKGYGMYWETEEQAQAVLAAITKPFGV